MDVQPVYPLERLLAQFWNETLARDDSDRLTNFFAAGGHDTEAQRLLSMIEDAFHVEMPLTALHDAPTVRAFAKALKHQVDHPGRLERLAERLLDQRCLESGHSVTATSRGAHRAGATW
jgi:acyl carrier protein